MGFASSCNNDKCANAIQSPHQGICPSGWHIPSQAEWNTLLSYVQSNSGCSSCGGRLLKATSGWSSSLAVDGNGTDDYGFSALPGGEGIYSDGYFNGVGTSGKWWSASEEEDSSFRAYRLFMPYFDGSAGGIHNGKLILYSVRCLKD